ncbi:MAG: glycosyltransferase family 4 protein [Hyphomicrobiales bacterium]|nr:glycosyltransferase family 4 protein [Hyphomicrobiales bacterium]
MKYNLDITRIYARSWRSAPTGIDRVEWAYAQFLSQDDDTAYIATLPGFSGMLPPDRAQALFARIRANWNLSKPATEDAVLKEVGLWLGREPDPARRRPHRAQGLQAHHLGAPAAGAALADVARAPLMLRRDLTKSVAGRHYLNVSHLQIDHPQRFAWALRNQIPVTLLLHDVIPIDHPEFCRPGAARQHEARLRGAAALGARLIVNSEFTRARVAHHWDALRLGSPPVLVAPLGIEAVFAAAAARDAPPDAAPYFLCVGTIEPRKNLAFLLEVWRRLVERHGMAAPRLVLAGHRGWENQNIIALLERSAQLASHVMEVSGLSDSGLAALMAGARGVLAPSLVEGYSLPVLEAQACGAAVVASDIAVHREVAGSAALLLHPLDGPGWIDAITRLHETQDPLGPQLRGKSAGVTPVRWDDHMRKVMAFVAEA